MTPEERRARLHGGRLAWERISELAAMVAIEFVCFGVVSFLRWVEADADAHGWTAVFITAAVMHVSVDVALIVFIARGLYRWARGRSAFGQ